MGRFYNCFFFILVGLASGLTAAAAAPAGAAAPLNYFTAQGPKADTVVPLTWGVTIVSLAVIVIIAALLAIALWWRPGLAPAEPGSRLAVGPDAGGLSWLWIGVGVSTLVLVATIVWTIDVLARMTDPPSKPAFTVEVTAHQWWWQLRYLSGDPSRIFQTANEIHIPVGQPVLFKLVSADVIHSFWVPALSGKTDVIPGQTNQIWLEASKPGIYRGQCAEYCGLEHAKMSLLVIADTPANFRRWWDSQLQLAPEPADAQLTAGRDAFAMHCGSCHAVRGTDASGVLGPDLSHLMQRHTIAAGVLPNDSAHLLDFIRDPQGLKPGIFMQPPQLSGAELADIHAYLATLR